MKENCTTYRVVLDVLVADLDGRTKERRNLARTPEHKRFQSLPGEASTISWRSKWKPAKLTCRQLSRSSSSSRCESFRMLGAISLNAAAIWCGEWRATAATS